MAERFAGLIINLQTGFSTASLAPQENIIVHMAKRKKKMTVAQKAAKKKR